MSGRRSVAVGSGRAFTSSDPQFALCPQLVIFGDALIVTAQEGRGSCASQCRVLSRHFLISIRSPQRVLNAAERVVHFTLPSLHLPTEGQTAIVGWARRLGSANRYATDPS